MNRDLDPQLVRSLERYGQSHVLAFWDRLDDSSRAKLAAQLAEIDFGRLAELYQNLTSGDDWQALAERAAPPPAVRLGAEGEFSRDEARAAGREVLRAGRVAAIIVAGGQGTRLGFDHPKGMYPIGPVSGATLFQYLLEGALAASRRYGAPLPVAIMTSEATHRATEEYLAREAWFGLPKEQVTLFQQGSMPALDAATGRVLLAEPDSLALGPDGHGGMLAALDRCGLLADWQSAGIEQVFYCQVDNPLVTLADPEFIGFHLLHRVEVSTQVVAKAAPDDRLGNVVMVDGQMRIIEYSDLPESAGQRRTREGSLELWAGSIAVHVFDLGLLSRAARHESLPFHRAVKRVPYLDTTGQHVVPPQPNALKFERFIFDLLPLAGRSLVVEVARRDAFAPLKNAPGAASDTPAMVREMLADRSRRWLRSAGATVADDAIVEIRAPFALDVEELEAKLPRGLTVGSGTYFS